MKESSGTYCSCAQYAKYWHDTRDIDVTPMDNSGTREEDVFWTYMKFEGYDPIMTYLGKEGHLVNTQLSEGNLPKRYT